ncbi:YebC/PmpR family DNA-binding transcriptional regulator [Candidatus Daviesbacteria bacterium]|nr:YebC/PmpR family DNA-binding transcriptional regulator [Candidatus Daviesbacteria bacterium]
MSGHSKWSTIKRQKGAVDIKRGATFTKIANAITIAARLGGSGDPNSNPRLRVALDSARAANMPKENVQRAIDRGLGKLPGQMVEEVLFEGFGPSKVAFIVEAITDNRMRTLAEMRNLFEKGGGVLGSHGSTSYMFSQKGKIKVKSKGGKLQDEILELIDLGVEDVEDFQEDGVQKYLVYTESSNLSNVGNNIAQSGFEIDSKEIVYKPTVLVEMVGEEAMNKVLEFVQRLEDHDDVQKVHSNFVISESAD